jgi:hypothetical protein
VGLNACVVEGAGNHRVQQVGLFEGVLEVHHVRHALGPPCPHTGECTCPIHHQWKQQVLAEVHTALELLPLTEFVGICLVRHIDQGKAFGRLLEPHAPLPNGQEQFKPRTSS